MVTTKTLGHEHVPSAQLGVSPAQQVAYQAARLALLNTSLLVSINVRPVMGCVTSAVGKGIPTVMPVLLISSQWRTLL